jgi:hypothetical protein
MTKGVHYNETFSATPKEGSTRIMSALVVLLNLKRLSFDITKAYCWADLPPGELIALKYPSAFEEYDPITTDNCLTRIVSNYKNCPFYNTISKTYF